MLIYRIIFPNGKMYIGLTTRTLRHRKYEHKGSYSRKENNWPIYNAINKYGWDNIKWEVIEDNILDYEYLKEREQFNILKYDTYLPNGYNMTLGGQGRYGRIISEETRRKMSSWQRGVSKPKELMDKLHDCCRGRKQSKEEIKKRRKSLLKYTYNLIDKNGNIYNNIEDLMMFCKDKKLNYLSLKSKVLAGINMYKGWIINKNRKEKLNMEN